MQSSPPSGQMKDSPSQFPCCWADQFDWFSFMGCEWKLNELNTSEWASSTFLLCRVAAKEDTCPKQYSYNMDTQRAWVPELWVPKLSTPHLCLSMMDTSNEWAIFVVLSHRIFVTTDWSSLSWWIWESSSCPYYLKTGDWNHQGSDFM